MKKISSAIGVLSGLMLFVSLFNSLTLVSGVPVITGSYHVPEELLYMEPDFYCDLNNDGKIDIKDVSIVTKAWGSHGPDFEWPGQEPSENWDRRADINNDNYVDIRDVATVASRFGLIEDPPLAYSTSFEFDPSADAAEYNWVFYYLKVRVYVPLELSEQEFYLTGYALWALCHIKLDGSSIEEADSGDVNISLGTVCGGWHLLEFEYADSYGLDGILNFQVATLTGHCAWLVRFCIYVPNYSENEYKYIVKTCTWCPIFDDYFLKGYADDYIDALSVDGLKWWDWEWSCHPYETAYAWGDGFCYSLGELPKEQWYDICFTFGEIWLGGVLDFQVVSWTHQRDRIGNPRFRAVGSLNQGSCITVNSAMFYGGSKWKFEDDPQFSERYFEARQVIDATYGDGETWFDGCFDIGLGLGWAEWALLPATEDDVGITMNLTRTQFESNRPEGWVDGDYCFWSLGLKDRTVDIYSFQALEIKGLEFSNEGESIVNQDLTVAMDYTGSVIMFVASALQPYIGVMYATIGATVGLSVKGIAAIIKLSQGQEVCRCQETISEYSHRQLCFTSDLYDSDVVFFKLNPAAGKRCGMTKVVLKGTLTATYWILEGGIPPREIWEFPCEIGNIEITLCIPWFLRG